MVITKLTAEDHTKKCVIYDVDGQQEIFPFKVKLFLSAQKTVNIKKNGQFLKTINVRRKSRYFSGGNRLIF